MSKADESIIKPALVLMSGRVLGFMAAFVLPIVLVRLFDQSEFGTYKQLFLIYGTLFGIFQLGVAESLYYFLPGDPQRAGSYVRNAILLLGISGAVCALLLWILRVQIAGLLNNPSLEHYLLPVGLFVMFMLMSVILEIVLTARRQNLAASAVYAGSDLLRTLLCLVPAMLTGELKWLLAGILLFALMRLTATLYYLRHEFGHESRAVDAGLMHKHLAYALPFGCAGLIEILQANLHMYAVSYHFDAATFAIYAVGCFQIPMIDYLMTSTSNVLMVSMREKLLKANMPAVLEMWRDTTRKLVIIFCLIVGGLLSIADELIVLLFTADYRDSVPVFMVWTLSMLFAGFLTDGVLRVFAQTRFLIVLSGIKLFFVAVTINWFLDRYHLLGAVLVTLLAALIAKLIALWRVKGLLQTDLRGFLPWRDLGQLALISVCAVLSALLIKSWSGLEGLAALLLGGTAFTTLYALLLLFAGPLSRQEKLELLIHAYSPVSRVCRGWKA